MSGVLAHLTFAQATQAPLQLLKRAGQCGREASPTGNAGLDFQQLLHKPSREVSRQTETEVPHWTHLTA